MKKHLKVLIGIGVTCFVVVGVVLGIVILKNVPEDNVGTVQEHVVNTDPGKCVVSFNVGVPELVSNLGNYSDQIITKGKKMKKPKEPKCDVATFDGWELYESLL